MTALQAALLGIIQGLTEFLPISSSAHLILARTFFGWEVGKLALTFDVACHVGTLLAVLVYFRRDIAAMIAVAPVAARDQTSDAAKLLRSIAIGTVPILVVGLLAADLITGWLRSAEVAVFALGFGGIIMIAAERIGTGSRSENSLTWREALGLGVAQAVALVPGVSRAGAVLTVAMFFGLRRERAARFSFLLGIPAILGAAGRSAIELVEVGMPSQLLVLFAVGVTTSAVVGYVTVKYFIRFVANFSLNVFAVYRLVLAATVLVWILQGRSSI